MQWKRTGEEPGWPKIVACLLILDMIEVFALLAKCQRCNPGKTELFETLPASMGESDEL